MEINDVLANSRDEKVNQSTAFKAFDINIQQNSDAWKRIAEENKRTTNELYKIFAQDRVTEAIISIDYSAVTDEWFYFFTEAGRYFKNNGTIEGFNLIQGIPLPNKTKPTICDFLPY